MHLQSLRVQNLRVLADAQLDVDADLIVLTGANGSGKTSLLEAVHLLGTGRSFRARPVQDVLRRGEDVLTVSGRFQRTDQSGVNLGVEKCRDGSARYRISGEDVRVASDLARQLPLVVVTPDSQRLLSDGAEGRRRLLDWLMFHVEQGYQTIHARYRRALRQRNAMLREGSASPAERRVWCEELASAGNALSTIRAERLAASQALLERSFSELSALPVQLEYRRGWTSEDDLYDLLMRNWDADAARGYTVGGPHRADLAIKVHGRAAQHVVSRGEGKVLVFAVMVGFARALIDSLRIRPVVLVDELASELDADNRAKFSQALRDLDLQTFITAVSGNLVSTNGWARVSRFELEQGKLIRVLQ